MYGVLVHHLTQTKQKDISDASSLPAKKAFMQSFHAMSLANPKMTKTKHVSKITESMNHMNDDGGWLSKFQLAQKFGPVTQRRRSKRSRPRTPTGQTGILERTASGRGNTTSLRIPLARANQKVTRTPSTARRSSTPRWWSRKPLGCMKIKLPAWRATCLIQ